MRSPIENEPQTRRQRGGDALQFLLFAIPTLAGGPFVICLTYNSLRSSQKKEPTATRYEEQPPPAQNVTESHPPKRFLNEYPGLPHGTFLDLKEGKPVVSERPILFAITLVSEDGLMSIFAGEEAHYAGSFPLEVVRARHGIPLFGIPKLPDDMMDTTRIVPLTTGGTTIVGNVLILLTNERGHPVGPDGTLLTKPDSPVYFVDLGNVKEVRRIA